MNILIAPDKFKGTLDARQAALAIQRGIRKVIPALSRCTIDLCPLADGGDGTVSVLVEAVAGRVVPILTEDPLGRPVYAGVGLARIEGVPTALVESASASGLALLKPSELNPYTASTSGTGKLVSYFLHRARSEFSEISKVLVCVGGTATLDAGLGALAAMGASLLDETGAPLHKGDRLLFRTHAIDPSGMDLPGRDGRPEVQIATDVTHSMLGESGCVRTFGPQKGLHPSEFGPFEEAMRRVANLYGKVFGIDPGFLPRSGAGGGLAGGLAAAENAQLLDGFEIVATALRLRERIANADVVITGEGAVDRTSFEGKAIGKVVTLASSLNKRVAILAGRIEDSVVDSRLCGAFKLSLESLCRYPKEAVYNAANLLEIAAERWALEYSTQ